ncbi:hypothetical protein BHM03_00057050 [Ensete ventricosum]|uniref:Uncharacterized protein n=1 Tax=Ensete ventricosum TaxID=4639 RepID=A0A445MMG7_ENSVE|nr:hypothetical protein BHM03_00057050 [Ensete ventricosum]
MELYKASSTYGNLRVFEDYSKATELTAHASFQILQSNFLATNKHQVEFCCFTVDTLAKVNLLCRLKSLHTSTEECFMHCARSIVRKIPYVGLNFAVYESLKDWLIKTNPYGLVEDSELSVVTRLGCGAVAGTVGQTVAYPLDVIRRRMQMVGWKDAASVVTGHGTSKAPLEYNGMVDAFRKTVRNEGFSALYKGLVPNSVKVVPSIAIAFVTYEVVKDVLGVEMRISD